MGSPKRAFFPSQMSQYSSTTVTFLSPSILDFTCPLGPEVLTCPSQPCWFPRLWTLCLHLVPQGLLPPTLIPGLHPPHPGTTGTALPFPACPVQSKPKSCLVSTRAGLGSKALPLRNSGLLWYFLVLSDLRTDLTKSEWRIIWCFLKTIVWVLKIAVKIRKSCSLLQFMCWKKGGRLYFHKMNYGRK